MTRLMDDTLDCEDDARKLAIQELMKMCETELANIAEREADKIANPQFYT